MDPIQPSIQEPIQTPVEVPTTSQPKRSYLKTILFSVLITITLGLITYLIFQNQKLQKQVTIQQITPPIQTSSPTLIPTNETDGWKIYTNEVCKYTIKFPIDWKKTSDPFVGEESINVSPLNTEVVSSSDRSINISATPLNKISTNNLQDQIDSYNSFLWKNWADKKIQNISFKNYNSIQATGKSYNIEHKVILLKTDDCYFELKGTGDYIETFDQILSTFEFVELNNSSKLSEEILTKGWYWGFEDQKKPGTPDDWVYKEAGRSSCWHKLGIECL